MVQDANADYLAAVRIAMIHDAASLIADMQVKQNGKTVYDSNNLYRVTNIKNFLTMSHDYANSSATSEYFYLDTGDTTIKDGGDANYNKGFTIRSALVLAGKIQNSIIPLNKFFLMDDKETFFRQVKDIPKIENVNDIIFNVLVVDDKQSICPLYISNTICDKTCNLLLMENDNKNHYVWIKNFAKLMNTQSKHKHKLFFCYYFLQHFTSENILKNHTEVCLKINEAQKIKMPNKNKHIFH